MKYKEYILFIQFICILTISPAQDFFPKPYFFNENEIRKYKIKSVKRVQDGWSSFEEYNEKGLLLSYVHLDYNGKIFERRDNKYNNAGELIETIYYNKEQGERKSKTLFYKIGDTIHVKKQYYLERDSSENIHFTTEKYNLRKKIIRREWSADGRSSGVVTEYSYFPNDTLKEEIEYYTSNIEKGVMSDSVEIRSNKKFNKYGKILLYRSLSESEEYTYLNDTLPLKEVYKRFEDGFEQTRKREYDKNNRLIKEYYIDVDNGEQLITLSLKYNSKGDTIEKKSDTRLWKYEYVYPIRKEFIYDILYGGNIIQEIWRDKDLRIIKSIFFDKNVISFVHTYKFDDKGRITGEYSGTDKDSDGQLVKKYEYDNEGNKIYFGLYQNNKVRKEVKKSFSNGKLLEEYSGTYGLDSIIEKHIYKYDEKLRIIRQEMWNKNKPGFIYDFQYDHNGNIIKVVNSNYFKTQEPKVTTYQYAYGKYNFLEEEKMSNNSGVSEIKKKIIFEYY